MTQHNAIVRQEKIRGCGWRKVGGMYLVADGPLAACGKLPAPLPTCPCCSFAVKLSRAPRWLGKDLIKWMFDQRECENKPPSSAVCAHCLAGNYSHDEALMVTVGERHYPSVFEFVQETLAQGFSRRISSIPRKFIIGETYVLLAHAKSVVEFDSVQGKVCDLPGVFGMIKPSRIEIVVTNDTPYDMIDAYVKRGLTPVIIERVEAPAPVQEEMGLHATPTH